MMKKREGLKIKGLIELFVLGAIALVLAMAVVNVERQSRSEGRARLEAAIRKAAVACYAAEGVYPESLDRLVEDYGIQLDEGSYSVHYVAVAENLMPEITVIEKKR